MSLDYYFDKIENFKTVCYDDTPTMAMKPEAKSMVFLTMHVGMPRLTAENVAQFYRRYKMLEPVFGWNEKETGLTYEFMLSMVGLATNASTKTDAAFRKDVVKELEHRAEQRTIAAVTAYRKKQETIDEIMELL